MPHTIMPHSGAARSHSSAQRLTESAYRRWAPVYDVLFDLPFHPGRLAAATAASEAAGRNGTVLVVGVGTGLELSLMRKDLRITGVDLSAPMLDFAYERVSREALGQVEALHVMDAGALEFPDAQFDVTLAPYVISVVPTPARVLDEMWRVLRPGGQMIVMNHFAAERGPRVEVESAMERLASWLGWHPKFPYAAVGDWIAAQKDAQIVERRELAPFKLFTLLRIVKDAPVLKNR